MTIPTRNEILLVKLKLLKSNCAIEIAQKELQYAIMLSPSKINSSFINTFIPNL